MLKAFLSRAAAAALLLYGIPVFATFHDMQIEQVLGGIDTNTNIQAIQLRQRFSGQNFVAGTELKVYDATGNNPVTLLTLPSQVSNGNPGARILIASAQFAATYTNITPDFTMTNLIPASYLAAGRLTFESSFYAGPLWSVSWGGASYTGSNTGNIENDADGNFGPPFNGPLPFASHQALLFQGSASAQSTTNAADYALTPGDAVFINNSDGSTTVPVELSEFSAE